MNISPYSKAIILYLLITFFSILGFGQEKSNFIKLNQDFTATSNIVEDKLGFIRISGSSGIYKYNGYDFSLTTYRSLFGANFKRDRDYLMVKDDSDNIWISTFNGELTKLNADGTKISYKDKLTHNGVPLQITSIKADNDVWLGGVNGVLFKHHNNKIDSITALPKISGQHQRIESIAIIDSSQIWMSTFHGKIYNYSLTRKALRSLDTPLNSKVQNIRITNDNYGKLWIATELQGLYSYDTKKDGEIKQYDVLDASSTDLKHHMFISIFCDSSGVIWAGTDGDGLYRIDPQNEDVTIFRQEETNRFSISNNTVTHVNEDSKGNIWIVAKKGKINVLPKSNDKINYYNGLENNSPTSALSILKSSDGSLWIGTDGKGLNRVFPNQTKLQYDINKKGTHFFEGRYIQSLVEDSRGNIWIGTYQKGLWVFNPKTNRFTNINTTNDLGDYSTDIRFLFKDSKNRIWVTSGAGINIFSDEQELLATYDYNANGLFGNMSMSICEDENGSIWLGINPGRLFKFNENVNDLRASFFTKHNYYVKQEGDSRNYNIYNLVPDYQGHLWISCASGMLMKYDLISNTYESYADRDHFKNIGISTILIEDSNNLWFSSINGIHHYSLESDEFKSYYQMDGFQSNNFMRRSSFKDADGTFYFGNENGVNSFLPSDLVKEEAPAKLYINTIEILNKPASLIVADQVKNGVEYVKTLELDSDQSSFSFQFSAVENLLNTNYHYAYKLHGFDSDWVESNTRRMVSYTNIPYGDYTFEVKAGSKKGEWNIDPVSIAIYIKPPWWFSSWAYAIYIIGGLLIAYGIMLWLRLKNRLAKEAWQNNQEKELYALKMNFFAKMSHEIQTPLTLILGPIGDMLERAGANKNELLRQRLQMISNNANRLSRIATELMTIRNKELGKLRIFASKNNLIKDLERIALSFSEQARFKNIDFIQQYPKKDINVWYDSDKIEHVIYNLLSNAFKFTPREGVITLKVGLNQTDEFVEISVTDSGPGIPKDELDDIFKLFYQSDLGKHAKGIGIGLALTKELISLHQGEINVVSSPETGTCFSVKLSTKETIFSEDEKIYVENSNAISKSIDNDFIALEKELNLKTNTTSDKKYTLLIVEDNIEMQMFLRDVLGGNYNLLIAGDGKEGITLAEKHIPDLIISDIMMPILDGIEMCKMLQKKKSTSHIPIILLTAKNTTTTKIKGLRTGAIEYIKKPFNFYELTLKVNNIISSKEKALSKYKTDLISSPEVIKAPSKDDVFMENLVRALDAEIENPDFKLEELAEKLNMSYSVVYRKCQDITGKSLIDFVKSRRIKKAALLIIQHGYNISEASFMVGYKDSKYFTKRFKEEFGVPPATFKRDAKNNDAEALAEKYKILL